LLSEPERRAMMAAVNNPYGDGLAAKRIVEILLQEFTINDGSEQSYEKLPTVL